MRVELEKLILVGTRITYQATGDAGYINIPIIVFRLIFHSSFADLSPHRRPSRAVSSPERASASAAAAGAADSLARCRTRSREASTSESTTGICSIYGAFLPLSVLT